MGMNIGTENSFPPAKEGDPIKWVPLLELVSEINAEMLRGFLESEGIPVQVRRSKKFSSVTAVYYSTLAKFVEFDIYVSSTCFDKATQLLGEIQENEDQESEEDDVQLVWDDAGELQEVMLSPDKPCPACAKMGIEHDSGKNYPGFEVSIFMFLMMFLIPVVVLLIFSFLDTGLSMTFVFAGTFLLVGILLVYFWLKEQSEKWYCTHCKKEWHK
jgi:hypothetical protein